MFEDVQIVPVNWLSRLCHALFGSSLSVDESGKRIFMAEYQGVVYVLQIRLQTMFTRR